MRIAALALLLSLPALAPAKKAPKTPTPTPTPATQGDWVTFKGDNARTGRSWSRLGLPISEKWRTHLRGSLYSSPIIVAGKVYLGSSAKRLTCLDLGNGNILWQTELPDRVWGSAPAYDSGRVFIGTVDGCVYALDAGNGKILGSYCAIRKGVMGEKPDVLSSPLIEDGRLVFGSDNWDVYGWDLSGQRPLWRFSAEGIFHDNSASSLSGTAYIACRDGKVYALGLQDGALRWSTEKLDKPFNTVPSVDASRVYLGDGDSILRALDPATGKELWRFKAGIKGIMSSPSLDGQGGLYFGSSDTYVYSLDAATGQQRWKFATDDVVLGGPLLTGGLAWVGSFDERFYALDMASGKQQWSTRLKGGVFCSAASSGNYVVVAGRGGDVACFQATPLP